MEFRIPVRHAAAVVSAHTAGQVIDSGLSQYQITRTQRGKLWQVGGEGGKELP